MKLRQPSPEMKARVTAVERIIGYDFKDKKLLEEALTHPSSRRPDSYQRLELLGDSVLNHAVTKCLFRDCRKFNEEQITNRRKATVSNPNLARIGARLGLYDYLLRHNTPDLDDQVEKFTEGVIKGKDMTGSPGFKVLADIVESVAAAVYVDLNYDLDQLLKIFKPLLDLEESDCMMKAKESDSMLDSCLGGIILLVIFYVLAKLIGFC